MGKPRKRLTQRKGSAKRRRTSSNETQPSNSNKEEEENEEESRSFENNSVQPSSSSVNLITPPETENSTTEFVFAPPVSFSPDPVVSDENVATTIELAPVVSPGESSSSDAQLQSNRTSVIVEIIDVDKLPERPDSPPGDDVIEISPPRNLSSRSSLSLRHYVDLTNSESNLSSTTSDITEQNDLHNEDGDAIKNDEDKSDSEDLPNVLKLPSKSPNSSGSALTISCPICMEDAKEILSQKKQLMSTICGHVFCNKCIMTSLETKGMCPTCRKKLKKKQLHPIFI